MEKAELTGIRRNVMGTTSFNLKIKGMRKPQDFIVYPLQKGDSGKIITIQSDTRIGKIDLTTGNGMMSKSHSGGAYFIHLSIDPKTPFALTPLDLQALKMHIFVSAGSEVGEAFVLSDNSQAINVL